MKPVAKVVDAGGVAHFPKLQWADANTSLETPIGTELFTADQVKEAQVKVLREAADAISKGMPPNKAREMIRRMADELEKQG